jgi:hypothetical protein
MSVVLLPPHLLRLSSSSVELLIWLLQGDPLKDPRSRSSGGLDAYGLEASSRRFLRSSLARSFCSALVIQRW